MEFCGSVPSEHSTGNSRRQGALTQTGNAHVRRVLFETAWGCRSQRQLPTDHDHVREPCSIHEYQSDQSSPNGLDGFLVASRTLIPSQPTNQTLTGHFIPGTGGTAPTASRRDASRGAAWLACRR
ncbi:MAG: transposase [Kofleriaceae bacterium]